VRILIAILIFCAIASNTFASGARPSFDCSKAKRPDEQAICSNDELANGDQQTTNAFTSLRRRPETAKAALDAARAFLNARHACGPSIDCIREAQKDALATFAQIGGTSRNDTEGAANLPISPAPGAPARPNGDFSWSMRPPPSGGYNNEIVGQPAFTRRNFQLGITLSQFLRTPYPDADLNAYPVCSDNIPTDWHLDYSSVNKNIWRDLGVIKCSFFITEKYFNSIIATRAGLILGNHRANFDDFYFFANEPGAEPVLFFIYTQGRSVNFEETVSLFAQHFGRPTNSTQIPLKNGLGNSFQSIKVTYENSSIRMDLDQYAGSLNFFSVTYVLKPLFSDLMKLNAAVLAPGADQL
jgi:uncharacterized protein YecT (DUF1311 family)